jgi:hypothetical protein
VDIGSRSYGSFILGYEWGISILFYSLGTTSPDVDSCFTLLVLRYPTMVLVVYSEKKQANGTTANQKEGSTAYPFLQAFRLTNNDNAYANKERD